MSTLFAIIIVVVGLILLGPIGIAILATILTAAWLALRLALYLSAILLGAIIFPVWWLFDREAAVAAWKAGRVGKSNMQKRL